nr:hypothetical protein [Aquimarina longa]
MYPTIKATRKTMMICDLHYKHVHHTNGKANAFRHALWNILICKAVFKITKNIREATIWAEKITNLHEKIAVNELLETAMDLHNNKIGRLYFLDLDKSSDEEMIFYLKEKVEKSIKVTTIKEMKHYQNDLVYLQVD